MLDFEFTLADAMRFIPMNFCSPNRLVGQTNTGEALEFAPTASTIYLAQTLDVPNRTSDSDNLHFRDVAEEFKFHTSLADCFRPALYRFLP